MKFVMTFLVLMSVSGCFGGGEGPDPQATSGSDLIECGEFAPIYLPDAALPKDLEDAVLFHNEYGARRGCW